jgi:hypothetical protein
MTPPIKMQYIGPSRADGHFLAGYFRPGHPGQFMPLAHCNTREQAIAAVAELKQQQAARMATSSVPQERRQARGWYSGDN